MNVTNILLYGANKTFTSLIPNKCINKCFNFRHAAFRIEFDF